MPKDTDKNGNGDDKKTTLSPEEIKVLQEKVSGLEQKHIDLNKGIAGYRDTAQEKEKRVKELEKEVIKLNKAITDVAKLEGIDTKDKDKFEKWAKAKGFITKEELAEYKTAQITTSQRNIQTQAVTEFLEKHPDCNNDENWKKIQEEFSLYKIPTTLQGYHILLVKIYNSLFGKDKKGAKIRAELTKKSRLSLGGGFQKTEDRENEIENLQKKYPNLSREQIESQLNKVDSLFPEKEKE